MLKLMQVDMQEKQHNQASLVFKQNVKQKQHTFTGILVYIVHMMHVVDMML